MVTGVRSVRWGLNPRLGLKKNSHITKLEGALLAAVVAACIFLAGCGSGGGNSGGQRLSATVAATQHPLVANFLVGSECTGQAMAEFGPDTSYGRSTSWYPVTANKPLTIPVAGMRASTMYHMRVDRQCGSNTISSPDTTFTTGALPSMPFPAVQVSRPAPSPSSPENTGIELVDILAPTANQMQAFFTDRDGYPIWYYNVDAGYVPNTFKLLPNGHFLVSIANTAGDSLIREVDLAGNKIRELEIVGLQQKMQAAGFNFVPTEYHHDFLPLDNGHIIVLTNVDQDFTDLPGYPGSRPGLESCLGVERLRPPRCKPPSQRLARLDSLQCDYVFAERWQLVAVDAPSIVGLEDRLQQRRGNRKFTVAFGIPGRFHAGAGRRSESLVFLPALPLSHRPERVSEHARNLGQR